MTEMKYEYFHRDFIIVTMIGELRKDGSVQVHSPTIPFFHLIAPRLENWAEWCLPLLKETLERNEASYKCREVD